MAIPVLVMVSVRSLGELIQQALQETGLYSVALVNNDKQALERVNAEKFPVAVLDFDLHPNPPELLAALRSAIPELRIVVIGFDADAAGPKADELPVDVCLNDPFYLPDLFDALDDITGDLQTSSYITVVSEHTPFPSSVAHKKTADPLPEAPLWLQDVTRAAQHLARLFLESTAQAALITRGEQLWAYAGQLPQPAAEELARSIGHYWGRDGGSDMARFIRLDATAGEYMIYATGLGGEFVLALAYETEIPFSEIRSRAGDLARRLALPPQETPDSPGLDSAPEAEAQPEASPGLPLIDNVIPKDGPPLIPSDWRPDQTAAANGRQAFFEDLLSDIEIPAPGGLSALETSLDFDRVEVAVAEDIPMSENAGVEPSGLTSLYKSSDVSPDIRFDESLSDHFSKTRPTPRRERDLDAQPAKLSEIELEPETPTLHNLTYACVLIPRLPQHHLVGDLAIQLNQWITQASLIFGWRLEHLSIRPNYLHWVAVISPATSPGHIVRDLRQYTSQQIFVEFSRLGRENPSGDFWAPGFLIINGNDALSQQLVREFIGQTRSSQGVRKSRLRN